MNYDIEAVYKKVWPKMQRPLDIGYVNFVVNQYRKGKVLDVGCGFGELLGALREFGFECRGIIESPIVGATSGNKEFLGLFERIP